MSRKVEFELPELLTITHIQTLHEQFEALLGDQDNEVIVAQGAKVGRVDTAGLQLLLVAKTAAKERQIDWVWEAPSDVLKGGAKLLGMTQRLDIH
ncbi:STAS domain-containing protein [Marinagarivorans algicola]|uniref:STAS domain-containing protein n=1 Tax=Marinagarivorans algicola TaxID=1513270 RepID=UPI0006B8C592|nr:STAS domain-containing protein [Marinagarivorans algicola]